MFEALSGSRFAGVTWVVGSGAEVSSVSAGAYSDLATGGLDILLRSEGPRLRTATNGEMQVNGCVGLEMVVLDEKRPKHPNADLDTGSSTRRHTEKPDQQCRP